MSSRKKAESYKLYSCTHLSRAKINIKVEKSYPGQQKFVKYISKPNPSLTINSAGGQTTVFLPPSRSLLKPNESENESNAGIVFADSFECGTYSILDDTPKMKMEQLPKFTFESSEFDDFDLITEGHHSRYKPNILKTKCAKVQISALKNPKTNSKKDLVKEKISRKRKQTYNLSNIHQDDVILHETKRIKLKSEEKHSQIDEKFEKKGQINPKPEKRLKGIKIRGKENSCARVCPYMSELFEKPEVKKNDAFLSLLKNYHVSLESPIGIEDHERNPRESLLAIEDRQGIFAECAAINEDFTKISSEYQIGNEYFGESSTERQFYNMSIPINSEFFVPDYLDYLNVSDSISDSDEVHKLISPSLSTDIFDKLKFPILDTKPMHDINDKDLKSPSNLIMDLDGKCKNFISNNRLNTNSISFQNNLELKESNSIKGTNMLHSGYIPHFGAKDSLINGCGPIDIFSDIKENQRCQLNLLDINSGSDEIKILNPHVIFEFNKFFLSYAHVECYDENGTGPNCYLHKYVMDHVPVSPKSLMSIEDVKKEDIIDYQGDHETETPKKKTVQKKKNQDQINLERYQCPDCDIVFGKKRTLTIHRNKAHSGFYSHRCERCNILCNSKSHLQRHSQSCGSMKKALVCCICRKRYSYKSSLKQHLKNKHGISHE